MKRFRTSRSPAPRSAPRRSSHQPRLDPQQTRPSRSSRGRVSHRPRTKTIERRSSRRPRGGPGRNQSPRGSLQHALEAIALDPDDADSHYNLGRLYGLTGRPDQAIDQFRETVRLEPANAEAHFNLGTAYAQKDQMNEAIAEFRPRSAISPITRPHTSIWRALWRAWTDTTKQSPNSPKPSASIRTFPAPGRPSNIAGHCELNARAASD